MNKSKHFVECEYDVCSATEKIISLLIFYILS